VNFKRLYLSTFAGLDPARHLYEKFGFVLGEEQFDWFCSLGWLKMRFLEPYNR